MTDFLYNKEENIGVLEQNAEYKKNSVYYLSYKIALYYRYIKKYLLKYIRNLFSKDKNTILFISDDDYSKELLIQIMRQYPDKIFKILIPLRERPDIENKPLFSFNFFLQNKKTEAKLYKLPNDDTNIDKYGIYSDSFAENNSKLDFYNIKYLAPFAKCARIVSKKLRPDIIHSNNIPFFLGSEFEFKIFPFNVFQQIDDFYDFLPLEPFWSILNIADEKSITKLCKDKKIRKNIATLFKLRIIEKQAEMHECINLVLQNYTYFRKNIHEDIDTDENYIFKKLNLRTVELFPQLFINKQLYYQPLHYTLKRANFWAVISKTYYNRLFSNPSLSNGLQKTIIYTKYKSGYVSIKLDEIKNQNIEYPLTLDNFREMKKLNKEYLLKEFSKTRLETKFTSEKLYADDEIKVEGYLDSFPESILFFLKIDKNTNLDSVKLAVGSILKLLEQNKLFRIIINNAEKHNNDFLNNFINFCKQNSSLNGKWIIINGNINLPQFLSASDVILLPILTNPKNNLVLMGVKYGCIPVVSNNGLFNDIIVNIMDNMTEGCGFKTNNPMDGTTDNQEEDYSQIVFKAFDTYTKNPKIWNSIIKNALNRKTNWDFGTIEKYNEIYEQII